MKKLLAFLLTLIILAVPVTVFAQEAEQLNVFVTISDKDGKLQLAQEKITVTDTDNDGSLTVNDALYCAHEAKYEGGAAAGYATENSQWGLSLARLWGTANGGSYGYYINNASAMSLTDELKEGDYLNAYVYTDLTAWSDKYSYFSQNTVNADSGEGIELTLCYFDWTLGAVPVEGATITIDGEETEFKTDSEGKVTVKIDEGGVKVISAVSDTLTLVPPVCRATVAEAASINAYVTISDKDGKLQLAQEKITVTDTDKDGSLTVNDALYCAHEAKYEGGAAAGYATENSQWGLSLVKLWGTANGGSYGYYINNASAMSLTDELKEGDYLNAYVYTDLTAWSDKYSYFSQYTVSAKANEQVTLTLSYFDWTLGAVPVEGATITIDGKETEFKTDSEGKAVITLEAGEHIISAVSSDLTLVPPVCKAAITANSVSNVPEIENNNNSAEDEIPKTGDNSGIALAAVLMLASMICMTVITVCKKTNEK